jgi:predicted nucleic acid-binding protein
LKYVLDTNVVSAAGKRTQPVSRWLAGKNADDLYISVLTLGEIARGAEMKRNKDPVAAGHIDAWLEKTRRTFGARILPVTEAIAEEWGRHSALRTRGDVDGLIAATAIIHGHALVTRNVADFTGLGLQLIDPWSVGV